MSRIKYLEPESLFYKFPHEDNELLKDYEYEMTHDDFKHRVYVDPKTPHEFEFSLFLEEAFAENN